MKKQFFINFIFCGFTGWCFECLFTGIIHFITLKDRRLTCTTSLWMFPIYGLAAFIGPISVLLRKYNFIIRGGIYTLCIFFIELITGSILRHYHCCPWDYSAARFNIGGVIRFDYAPLWFIVGLLYEKLMTRNWFR